MQIGFINAATPEEYLRGNLLYSVGRSEEGLLPGQIVEAEVLFASDDSVNVRLSNGSVLRARLDNGITLAEGDTVWLSVKENDGKSLVLQIVPNLSENMDPAKTLVDVMAKAGLQNSRLGQSLVEAFVDSDLPLESALLKQAVEILEQNPAVNIKAAAFAAANKLDISSNNLSILEDLLRSDFKAGDLLARIFSLLTDEAAAKSSGSGLNVQTPTGATPTSAGVESTVNGTAPAGLPVENNGTAATGSGQIEISEAGGETVLTQTNETDNGTIPGGTAGEDLQQEAQQGGNLNKEFIGAQSTQPGYSSEKSEGTLPEINNELDLEQLLKAGTDPDQKAGSTHLLKAAEQAFFANVEQPEDAGALQKTAEQLLGRLELLKTYTESGVSHEKSAASETDRLISGMRLLESIDRYACMQIPVMTGGNPSTVEVYVFNKKQGAKKTNPDSTTILLALDTENLGRVEALVSIRKESIAIRFNLENEDIVNFFKERTVALYNMVSTEGQRLSGVQFQTGGETVTPLTAPIITEQYESSTNRTFNVRI